MIQLREELNQKITMGKQALSEKNLDLAINSFQRAAEIAIGIQLSSIIGISYAYIALALGHKGHREEALENINKASEYFLTDPERPLANPLAYSSVLLGLGVEFQTIELFECSIIILKNALSIARNGKADLEGISIITRTLAFSYSKIGNNTSAAKLYRIAGDLEDNSQNAINLYQNSAYLYYQEDMKEYALNVLQTAFEKAQIIKDSKMIEIAHFQGIISYEIAKAFIERRYLDQAIAYLDLSYEKFSISEDSFGMVKVLYEKAMVFESTGKVWQRNKVLEKVSQFKINKENEEYIIKSLLLLAIHALEGENFSQAEYYIQQVPQIELKPLLGQKIREIQNLLKQSSYRGQVQTDIRFSRKDLELPIEELIVEEVPREERLKQEELEKLQAPELEISVTETNEMKSPSIEVLHDLFGSSEQIPPISITQKTIISQISHEEDQEVTSSVSQDTRENQETAMALERLFKAHRIDQKASIPSSFEAVVPQEALDFTTSIPEKTVEEYPEDFQQDFSPPVSHDENIRSDVVRCLQKAGWAVELNFLNLERSGSDPDIIATKGLIRKTRKLIFFAENPTDAEICSFLLQSNPETGDKLIFLLNGYPEDANVSIEVKIVTQIDQLL